MKRLLPLLLIIFSACITEPPKQNKAPDITTRKLDPLTVFFSRCRNDLERASEVILKNDIIKNLTHLQKMNAGGKHYYLLERENISNMINAVTKGLYSDYILINKRGVVIYTKKNNDIFYKNVRSSMGPSSLKKCYDNRNRDIFFSDVTKIENFSGNNIILASRKVSGEGSLPGILVLQIDIDRIIELLGEYSFTIGRDGNYRIVKDRGKIHEPYEYFSLIDNSVLSSEKENLLIPEKKIFGRLFNYASVSWIVLREER